MAALSAQKNDPGVEGEGLDPNEVLDILGEPRANEGGLVRRMDRGEEDGTGFLGTEPRFDAVARLVLVDL